MEELIEEVYKHIHTEKYKNELLKELENRFLKFSEYFDLDIKFGGYDIYTTDIYDNFLSNMPSYLYYSNFNVITGMIDKRISEILTEEYGYIFISISCCDTGNNTLYHYYDNFKLKFELKIRIEKKQLINLENIIKLEKEKDYLNRVIVSSKKIKRERL